MTGPHDITPKSAEIASVQRFSAVRRRATVLCVLVLSASLPVLTTQGVAHAAGGPNVVQARSAAVVTLPDAGATLQYVESVALGQGSWTVTSNATAINFGPGDYVRCQLDANGQLMDGGATTYLADRIAGLVNVGTWKSTAAFTVALVCDHDSAASYAGQFYFDPGVTLTAVRGGPITSPTVHDTGTPKVVEARTTASVSLARQTITPVVSVTLPAGTWAAIGNASLVDFANGDLVGCYLSVSSGGSITSSGPEVGVGGYQADDIIVAGVAAEATAVIPAAGGVVTMRCSEAYATEVYVDPGATLTATLVPTRGGHLTQPARLIALPDLGGSMTNVVSKAMRAGPWRVTTEVTIGPKNPNGTVGGVNDIVRCALWAGATRIDGGAAILVTVNSALQEIVNAGTFTATGAWTLRLSCSHDHSITGGSHWTVFDGMAQGIDKGPIMSTS